MKKNVGTIDKVIRILIALVIIVLYFTNIINGTLGIILLIVAAIFILTSLFSICPIWMLFGLSTCKKEENK
jgi:hypothetical protein